MRRRLVWTFVLVFIAVGGAGLATAADREPTDQARPELTWRAEQAARPWIDAMAVQLFELEQQMQQLSAAGRQTLSQLSDLDSAAIGQALADGDAAAQELAAAALGLLDVRARQVAAIDDSRLSAGSRLLLTAIDDAAAVADRLPGAWREVARPTRQATGLLDTLGRHDEVVARAVAAGEQERFDEALSLLGQAVEPLAEASRLRDELALVADVQALDELLGRRTEHDAALVALYEEVVRSGSQQTPAVRELLAEVERARSALPGNDALRMFVAGAIGPLVAAGLVEIELGRGAVAEAIALLP